VLKQEVLCRECSAQLKLHSWWSVIILCLSACRNAEKHIREGIKAAQERGLTNSSTHLLPLDPSAKGAAGVGKASKSDGSGKSGKSKGKASKSAAKVQQQQEQVRGLRAVLRASWLRAESSGLRAQG